MALRVACAVLINATVIDLPITRNVNSMVRHHRGLHRPTHRIGGGGGGGVRARFRTARRVVVVPDVMSIVTMLTRPTTRVLQIAIHQCGCMYATRAYVEPEGVRNAAGGEGAPSPPPVTYETM